MQHFGAKYTEYRECLSGRSHAQNTKNKNIYYITPGRRAGVDEPYSYFYYHRGSLYLHPSSCPSRPSSHLIITRKRHGVGPTYHQTAAAAACGASGVASACWGDSPNTQTARNGLCPCHY